MEELQTQIIENDNSGCIECGHSIVLEGYPNKLCAECRQKYIKFPIPLWVKGFGIGVLVLVIISFVLNNRIYQIHRLMNKGDKLVSDQKYYSASSYFQKAIKRDSNNVKAHAMNMLCNYYNGKDQDMIADYMWLIDRNLKDDDVPKETLIIPNIIMETYPYDSLGFELVRIDSMHEVKLMSLEKYFATHPANNVKYYLANEYFDADLFTKCDTLLNELLEDNPSNISYQSLKVALLRRQGKFEEANKICDHLLKDNKESYVAYVMKAKIATASNHLKEAYRLIDRAAEFHSSPEDDITFLAVKLQLLNKENKVNEYQKLLEDVKIKFKDSPAELEYLQSAISKFN